MRFFLLAFAALSVFSCGTVAGDQVGPNSPDPKPPVSTPPDTKEEITTTITGRVVGYGNEPHTFVGIVDERGIEYAVYPPAKETELRNLQGHLIKFTVIMLDEPKGEGGLYLKGGTVTPVSWEIIR